MTGLLVMELVLLLLLKVIQMVLRLHGRVSTLHHWVSRRYLESLVLWLLLIVLVLIIILCILLVAGLHVCLLAFRCL